jgi:hypothetical protein
MTIAQMQVKQIKRITCDNNCNGPATHKDNRTDELLCQPHSFTIRREYREKL